VGAGHDPEVLSDTFIASVDDRVTSVVSVNDVVVGLICVGETEELDEAVTVTGGALSATMVTESFVERLMFGLTRVVHVEGTGFGIEVFVGGLTASP